MAYYFIYSTLNAIFDALLHSIQSPVHTSPKQGDSNQGSDGRDHHIFGFSVWMAGGGLRQGIVHGATDEIGFHAAENRHYVTDIHATILHPLGLDSRRLEIPGRKRLDIDHGQPIRELIG